MKACKPSHPPPPHSSSPPAPAQSCHPVGSARLNSSLLLMRCLRATPMVALMGHPQVSPDVRTSRFRP
eukprot:436701-Pyramimonas_sp.AAC.1